MNRTLIVSGPALPVFLGRPALEAVRLSGREGLNTLFEYELLLKTPDALNIGASRAADFNLDDFIGREICCSIRLDGMGEFIPGAAGGSMGSVGAGVRHINALVTGAAFWGEEGRHVQYKLTLRPWLHLATLSTDCKTFQNKTVVDVLDELLAGYTFGVDKRLIETYPRRDYQTQYNESDFAFFERLCQEWGISYYFEHSNDKHRLVLVDNMGSYKESESEAYRQVEYHPPGWKPDAEYIHAFVPEHHLTSGRYSTRDYDYTRPRADLSATRGEPRPTGHADAEVFHWHHGQGGSHYAQPEAGTAEPNNPLDEGRFAAVLRMQALRTHGDRARASGNLRAMVPGHTFTLTRHPRKDANKDYLVLDTAFLIEDVGQNSQVAGAAAERTQQWKVEVDLLAHPVKEPLRPELIRLKPHTHGPQTALVVGPEDQSVWTDALGRIKVQFPWDRVGAKNQNSSCWVRVSSPWAGNQLGGVQIPRIGQEVVIDFVGGDPDLPICTGRVHNQVNRPPWSLPGQAALSGFRSRELTKDAGNSAAGRSNHLVLDDSAAKIQAQLRSDHLHSQLALGHIGRIEDNAGRREDRGEGFELRSDGHGVIRAKEGMLISVEGRAGAAGHAKDMGETSARLNASRERHETLSAAALQAQAHSEGDQDEVLRALKAQNRAIDGSDASEQGKFPELSEPHLVLASPCGIETSTAASTHIASDEHNALTSGGHTSISAGKSLLASVKQAIRFFAYQSGIRLVAYGGDVEIRALKDSINVIAKLNITQTGKKITISAEEELFLGAAGTYIRLDAAGNEQGTNGGHVQYAASHSFQQPKNASRPSVAGAASLEELKPKGALAVTLLSHADGGRPLAFEPFTLYKSRATSSTPTTGHKSCEPCLRRKSPRSLSTGSTATPAASPATTSMWKISTSSTPVG